MSEKSPKDTAEDLKKKAEEIADKIEDKVEDAFDDAKDAIEELADKVEDKVEDAVEDVQDKAKETKAAKATKAEAPKAEPVNATGEREFEKLKQIPDLSAITRKVFFGALPGIGGSREAKQDPTSAIQVDGVRVDKQNLAEYTQATGLRLSNELPPTYFFVLGFPLTMELLSRPDFPYPAMGAVHISNVIEQTRPLTVDKTFSVRAYATNVRPHRRGLLVDVITEVTPDGEPAPVWKQTSSFLGMGAKFSKSADVSVTTRAEDSGKVLPPAVLPEFKPNARFRWTRSDVNAYVKASNDHNPIHTSNIGAKLFGFPAVIAHGMLSAASVLAPLEGKLPPALRYSVEFVKPVVIPASVALWTTKQADGSYDIQLRNSSKPEKLHLNGEVAPL